LGFVRFIGHRVLNHWILKHWVLSNRAGLQKRMSKLKTIHASVRSVPHHGQRFDELSRIFGLHKGGLACFAGILMVNGRFGIC